MRTIRGVTIFGPGPDEPRVGVVSLTLDDWPPHDLAAVLDADFGVEARAGLHCAPSIHRRLGTAAGGGTLRLSVGAFTTAQEIDAVVAALAAVAG